MVQLFHLQRRKQYWSWFNVRVSFAGILWKTEVLDIFPFTTSDVKSHSRSSWHPLGPDVVSVTTSQLPRLSHETFQVAKDNFVLPLVFPSGITVFLTVTNNRTTSRIKSLVLSLIQSVHLKLHPLNQIWSLMALKKDGDGRNTVTNQLMDDITVGLKSVSNRSVRESRAAVTMI